MSDIFRTKTSLTAFGESLDKDNRAFFTGKPHIGELGYAFLLGNYRADMGKWQTADPLGYPDGWNNFAYGNNRVLTGVDPDGCKWGDADFVAYYYRTSGSGWIDTDTMGLTSDVWDVISVNHKIPDKVKDQINKIVSDTVKNASENQGSGTDRYSTTNGYNFSSICYSMGGGVVSTFTSYTYSWTEYELNGSLYRGYSWQGTLTVDYSDIFMDPTGTGIELGNPYGYGHTWNNISINGYGTVKME